MAGCNLKNEVAKIAKAETLKCLKGYKAFADIGIWMKQMEDRAKRDQQRIAELEIRVRKLNNFGPTPVPENRATQTDDSHAETKPQPAMTAIQIKKIRMKRSFSKMQMAKLLGVSICKYSRWESGKSSLLPSVEEKIIEIRDMKGSELRNKMQEFGIFQTKGKRTQPTKGQLPFVSTKAKLRVSEQRITGNEVRALRKQLDITRSELAKRIGTKPKNIANWEAGYCKPNDALSNILRIMQEENGLPSSPQSVSQESISPQKNITEATPLPTDDFSPENLKRQRSRLGLTQLKFIRALGFTDSQVSRYANWECGFSTPNDEAKCKIMKVWEQKPIDNAVELIKTVSLIEKNPSGNPDVIDKNVAPAEKKSPKKPIVTVAEMRAFRTKHSFSQAFMGKLLGVGTKCYSNWESPKRDIAEGKRQAVRELLNCSTDDLQSRIAKAKNEMVRK